HAATRPATEIMKAARRKPSGTAWNESGTAQAVRYRETGGLASYRFHAMKQLVYERDSLWLFGLSRYMARG
ncbi:MAG: hypothetical protein KDA71_21525, partial [Planctomycetales bacterium]|nr:hypothetical protein [Planctomycetales bacterium]